MLQTAAHEFGHSLGLSHTDDKQALMAPFYRGFEQSPKLEKDDIRAIQVEIYTVFHFYASHDLRFVQPSNMRNNSYAYFTTHNYRKTSPILHVIHICMMVFGRKAKT